MEECPGEHGHFTWRHRMEWLHLLEDRSSHGCSSGIAEDGGGAMSYCGLVVSDGVAKGNGIAVGESSKLGRVAERVSPGLDREDG